MSRETPHETALRRAQQALGCTHLGREQCEWFLEAIKPLLVGPHPDPVGVEARKRLRQRLEAIKAEEQAMESNPLGQRIAHRQEHSARVLSEHVTRTHGERS